LSVAAEFFAGPVYPILDLAVCEERQLDPLALLHLWEDLGLSCFQLRAKRLAREEYQELALKLASRSRLRLIVNDHLPLLATGYFTACHLGQSDRLQFPVRPRGAFLGLSTHNLKEFRAALDEEWSYVALGPCFAGGAGKKEQMEPILSPEQLGECLSEAAKAPGRPVVLIGGLRAENYPLHPALPVPAVIGAATERSSLERLIKKVEEARALYRMET